MMGTASETRKENGLFLPSKTVYYISFLNDAVEELEHDRNFLISSKKKFSKKSDFSDFQFKKIF